VALVELVWVLFSIYDYDRVAVAHGLELLLNAEGLRIEKDDVALKALYTFRLSSKVDFEDCLIAESNASEGCEYTATFDKAAARYAGMRLI
jgi:predicted nucleic-acid-binding protein